MLLVQDNVLCDIGPAHALTGREKTYGLMVAPLLEGLSQGSARRHAHHTGSLVEHVPAMYMQHQPPAL